MHIAMFKIVTHTQFQVKKTALNINWLQFYKNINSQVTTAQ
jgi:hypothetical protein